MIAKITKENIVSIAENLDMFYRLIEEYMNIIGDGGYNSHWYRPKITVNPDKLDGISISTTLSRIVIPLGTDCEILPNIDCLQKDCEDPVLDVYDYVIEHFDGVTAFSFSWAVNLTDYEVTVDILRTRLAVGSNDVTIA